MKTLFASTARFLIFAVSIAGIFSYTNGCSSRNIPATNNNNSVTKTGIALSGAQEVPAVSTSGSGTLDVSYDKSTKALTYSASWTGMTDSVTMMHIHGPAERGTNAGVVYPIPDFTPGTAGTATGTVKLDEVKLKEAELLGGKYYYNIHTKTQPAGEIRGQIEF